jgi:hypothetical protein
MRDVGEVGGPTAADLPAAVTAPIWRIPVAPLAVVLASVVKPFRDQNWTATELTALGYKLKMQIRAGSRV